MTTIAELAAQAAGWFETAERPPEAGKTEGQAFVRLKDGAPDWITDLMHSTHHDCDILPDDWKYEYTQDALEILAECGDDEDRAQDRAIEWEPDCYNGELLRWVGSHTERAGYVEESVRDSGMEAKDFDFWRALACGQAREFDEVFQAVLSFLRRRAERTEEDAASPAGDDVTGK